VKVSPTKFDEVWLIEPTLYRDARGFFLETYQKDRYLRAGIPSTFVQDNVSESAHGALRGLHFQNPRAQGKLVYVLRGEVFDVAVDVRRGSPTFGKWYGTHLSAENHHQLWIPRGFAHGFCVTSEEAIFAYKCTDYYDAQAELVIRFDDPALGITWPVADPVLSPKDAAAPRLQDIDAARLPQYEGRQ